MCGLIWFVQMVHYPLMHHVDREDTYFIKNAQRTSWVVIPFMVLELATGLAMIFRGVRPEYFPMAAVGIGVLLILGAWAITFFRQVPRHQILIQCRYNGGVVDSITRINWGRTAIWSIRSLLLLWVLFRGLTA